MKLGKYELDILTVPNAYGFGRDWTLEIKTKKRGRSFWLGQDAKVFARILGAEDRYYTQKVREETGKEEVLFSDMKKHLIPDLIAAVCGEYSEDALDKLFKNAQDWDLHAGGG